MNNEGNLIEEVDPGNKFPISLLLHPLSRTGLRIKKICFIRNQSRPMVNTWIK